MKRYVYWLIGFISLLIFNLIVEAFVLPGLGLDNTERNDIYFQLWWVVVFLWLIFGLMFIDKYLLPSQDSDTNIE